MGRQIIWETKSDARKLAKTAKTGETYYTVSEMATHLIPYEDDQLYQEWTVTHRHPLLGTPMVAGSMSVVDLVYRFGPVYAHPPVPRGLHEEGPQVAPPFPEGEEFGRPLTKAEIRELEKRTKWANHARSGGKARR